MTLADLEAEVEKAREAFAAFNDTLVKPYPPEVIVRFGVLAARVSVAEAVWLIGRDYGLPAAMLFKLSDGNIDPRPRQRQ